MPAIGSKPGRSAQVEKILRVKRAPASTFPKKKSLSLAGDGPQSDSQRAAGDTFKQSPSYAADLQAARGQRLLSLIRGAHSPDQARQMADAQHAEHFKRAGFQGEGGGGDAYGGNKGGPNAHLTTDEPRTSAELLKFLMDGHAPLDRPKFSFKEIQQQRERDALHGSGVNVEELRQHGQLPINTAGLKGPSDTLHLKTGVHAALAAAELAARPEHAVMGGLDALVHGHPGHIPAAWLKAATGAEHISGSDVLKDVGVHNKIVRAIGGFAGDVALDPLTYLTFGAGGVARKAGENASRAVIRAGEKKVAQGATTREEVLKAAEQARGAAAAGKPTNKGLQVGVRVPFSGREIRTSGKTTAKVNKALGGSAVATKIHDSHLADRILPHIAPDFRPRGVSPDEHVARRQADRRLRAAAQRGRAKARHTREAIKNAVSDHGQRTDLMGAVEGAVRDMPNVTEATLPTKAHEAQIALNAAERKAKTTTRNAGTEERALRRRVLKRDEGVQGAIADLNKTVSARRAARAHFGNEARSPSLPRSAADEKLTDRVTGLHEADAEVAAARARAKVMIARAEAKPLDPVFTERAVGPAGTRPKAPAADRVTFTGADQHLAERHLADAQARKQLAGPDRGHRRPGMPGTAHSEQALVTADGKRWGDVRGDQPKMTTPHTAVAAHIAAENHRMAQEELARELLRASQVKPNYMEHKFPDQITPPKTKAGEERAAYARGGGFDPGKARKHDLPAHEINAAREQQLRPPLFETDAAKVQGHRELTHERRIARQDHADAIAATGAHVTPEAARGLPDNYGIYRRTASDNWTRLEKHEVNQIADHVVEPTADLRILNNKNLAASAAQNQRAFERPNMYRRITGHIKGAQTVWNPSYYTGNELGNQVFSWQADTSMKAWGQSHHAVNLLGRRNKFEQSAAAAHGAQFADTLGPADKRLLDLIQEGEKVGMLSGHYMQEVRHLTDSEPGRLRRISEHRENQARIASYISARTEKGMNPEEASDWVNKHHIDYGDLSPMEQKLRDYGIPFYTFTARNTRLQAEKLFQRPGKLATWEKAREDMAKAMGEDPEFAKSLRRYEQAGLPFVVHAFGHKVLFFPRSPIDLGLGMVPGSLDEAAKQIVSRANLIPKTLGELYANQSLFFRSKIEDPMLGTDQVPAPAWAPFMAKFVPGLAGYTHLEKGAGGKWFWRGKADYVVGLTPQTKFLSGLFTNKKPNQDLRSQNKLMNSLSFVGIKIGDEQASLDKAQAERLRTQIAKLTVDKSHMARNGTGGTAGAGSGWSFAGRQYKFQSQAYAAKEAKRKTLQAQLDKLVAPNKAASTTLLPRPLTPAEKVQKRILDTIKKAQENPADKIQGEIQKTIETQRILSGR